MLPLLVMLYVHLKEYVIAKNKKNYCFLVKIDGKVLHEEKWSSPDTTALLVILQRSSGTAINSRDG